MVKVDMLPQVGPHVLREQRIAEKLNGFLQLPLDRGPTARPLFNDELAETLEKHPKETLDFILRAIGLQHTLQAFLEVMVFQHDPQEKRPALGGSSNIHPDKYEDTMSFINFLPITIPQTFYLVESRADLPQVELLLNELHQNFFRYRKPNGGSNEYYEAVITLGTQTLGIRYVSPREDFENTDAFIITAFFDDRDTRVRVDFQRAHGETKEDATARWILAARAAIAVASAQARIPLLAVD